MIYGALADGVLLFHFAFIVFVVAGGVAVLRWHWVALLHVPSFLWGTALEFAGWICPLTPLELHLRAPGRRWPATRCASSNTTCCGSSTRAA